MALAVLLAWAGLSTPDMASATSLRFHGNGTGGIDRVKIRIDGPATPADVGASSFTLEWWMRALPGENTSTAEADVVCDTNDGWITGNIVFDRDVFGDGDQGDFGVALIGGRIAFGVERWRRREHDLRRHGGHGWRVAPRRRDAPEVDR